MKTTSTTLRDVFENHYRPERMVLPAYDTLKKWRQALNLWSTTLGRSATVADLTAENIDLIASRLAARGISELTIKSFRKHTFTLWWFCQENGACSNAPKRRPRGRPRIHPVMPPKAPPVPNDWTVKLVPKREKKRRLITVPQSAVESMLPTDQLDDLADAYILRKLRGCPVATAQQYRAAVDELEFLLDRPATIADLTNENIENVMWQVRENGRSIPTVNVYRKNLVALWTFAARRGVLKVFPDVDKMTEPVRVPIAWTRAELQRLWKACRDQKGTICGIPTADWLEALHGVLWDTGERIGAVLSAQWGNLDPAGWLTIKAECRKGKTEDRTSPLNPETLAMLDRIREPERDLIFPWPHCECTLYNRYRRMLKRAGLPSDRKRMFHCMRKSSASWLKAAGGNPTEHLGHSDPSVTRAYLAPSIVQTSHASDLLFRPALLLAGGSAQ